MMAPVVNMLIEENGIRSSRCYRMPTFFSPIPSKCEWVFQGMRIRDIVGIPEWSEKIE